MISAGQLVQKYFSRYTWSRVFSPPPPQKMSMCAPGCSLYPPPAHIASATAHSFLASVRSTTITVFKTNSSRTRQIKLMIKMVFILRSKLRYRLCFVSIRKQACFRVYSPAIHVPRKRSSKQTFL